MEVFVLSRDGKPLMPCKPAIARLLLKDKRAKCVKRTPFTIKLLVETTEYRQEVVAGMDTGSKTIGCAAISNGRVVYQSEIQIRQDISKKMERRRVYRRTRRGRKTRYRKPRWQNRASMKRKGRLAPSVRSKIESHLREKKFLESILPISRWVVETASFDIHKISNPDVKDYQEGSQKGFYNVKAYILHRDGYKCQKCKTSKGKLHVHHIVFKSNGGTNTPTNLVTLCTLCHKKLHNGEFEIRGARSKTKHPTEMGVIKSQLKKYFGVFKETFGYETKFKREQMLRLPKTHYNDAVAICCAEGEIVDSSPIVYLKRHVPKGDYRQTRGKHSEQKIPTGKLFSLRKFDYIETTKGRGFIKSKRRTGFFTLSTLKGEVISPCVNIKRDCTRLKARTTTLIESVCAHTI